MNITEFSSKNSLKMLQSDPQAPKLQINVCYLPKLLEMVLEDAKSCYNQQNKFSAEIFQQLNAIVPKILISSLDLLDKYTFIKYMLSNDTRCIYKVYLGHQHFYLRENVNYCDCPYFLEKVLRDNEGILCQHVLALKLALIVDYVKVEIVNGRQMSALMDRLVFNSLGFKGFDESDEW